MCKQCECQCGTRWLGDLPITIGVAVIAQWRCTSAIFGVISLNLRTSEQQGLTSEFWSVHDATKEMSSGSELFAFRRVMSSLQPFSQCLAYFWPLEL